MTKDLNKKRKKKKPIKISSLFKGVSRTHFMFGRTARSALQLGDKAGKQHEKKNG